MTNFEILILAIIIVNAIGIFLISNKNKPNKKVNSISNNNDELKFEYSNNRYKSFDIYLDTPGSANGSLAKSI